MIAFLVAGVSGGVGKTTTSLALMAAFRQRGLNVQPFKCGPDFLDAGHHTAVCGRVSRTLDTWMLSLETNGKIYQRACAGADAAIVEGMMGLFDGAAGGGEEGSSAEIARRLHLPVVLVLDAATSARSIAAVVKGFEVFDRRLRFAGVVLNRVAGEGHFRILADAIARSSRIPILGWFPVEPAVAIPERHLGLHTAAEETNTPERSAHLAALAERHLNLDLLLRCAFVPPPDPPSDSPPAAPSGEKVRLGVARDRAFCFYYEDNLDLLRASGAEIVEFSPLAENELPPDLDGLYLGGGYPELHARVLSANQPMLAGIRAFAAAGKPVYAECGGMMVLGETLTDADGQCFPMAGVLPLAVEMTGQLVRFGYTEVEFTADCLLGPKGTTVRGHSFHCSRETITGALRTSYRVRYSLSGREELEGYGKQLVLGSYSHLHFGSNPSLAPAFVRRAQLARQPAGVAS